MGSGWEFRPAGVAQQEPGPEDTSCSRRRADCRAERKMPTARRTACAHTASSGKPGRAGVVAVVEVAVEGDGQAEVVLRVRTDMTLVWCVLGGKG